MCPVLGGNWGSLPNNQARMCMHAAPGLASTRGERCCCCAVVGALPAVGRALANSCWLRRSNREALRVSLFKSSFAWCSDAASSLKEMGCILLRCVEHKHNQPALAVTSLQELRPGLTLNTPTLLARGRQSRKTRGELCGSRLTSAQARIGSNGAHVH